MMEFMTAVAMAAAPLLAAWITSTVVPWIKARTTGEQRRNLMMLVRLAVQAAQQKFQGKGRGKERNDYVRAMLKSEGMALDEEKVDELIEAAVLELRIKQDWALEYGVREEPSSILEEGIG